MAADREEIVMPFKPDCTDNTLRLSSDYVSHSTCVVEPARPRWTITAVNIRVSCRNTRARSLRIYLPACRARDIDAALIENRNSAIFSRPTRYLAKKHKTFRLRPSGARRLPLLTL